MDYALRANSPYALERFRFPSAAHKKARLNETGFFVLRASLLKRINQTYGDLMIRFLGPCGHLGFMLEQMA